MSLRNVFIYAILLSAVLPATPAPAAPSIRHYDLHVSLHPGKCLLEATATLTVAADNASKLELQLAPQARIASVRLANQPATYRWSNNGRISVDVPAAQAHGEMRLTIDYSGTFRDPAPENPAHNEDPTYGVAATISERGTFLAAGSGWYPHIPGSRSTFRLRVDAPTGTEAVTSGRRVELGMQDGRNYSVWQSNIPLPGLTLAAGPYEVQEDNAGGIPLYTYFYPGTAGLSENYLKAARNYLELYVELFGPYPFEKFAVVENFFPTGYGFPSWTLLGSSVVRLPFIVETSLGHEIAHSWWGTGVRADYRFGNWSEGLTTYVADHLYKERVDTAEGREYRLKILRDYASLVPPGQDFPLHRFAARRSAAEQAVGYGKAAMIFHMARRQIGEQAFWSGLRTLATERMGGVASWDDFADQLGRASGQDLKPFFRQWLDRPGAPVLRLSNVRAERKGNRWRVSGTLLQEGTTYDLRVPLRLETANGRVETILAVAGRETRFDLESSERPQQLAVDPEIDLFRRLDPAEIPPTVNTIRGSSSLTVVIAEGLSSEMLAASRLLLAALRQEGASIRRESETSTADLRGRDILFLGLPRRTILFPPLPDGLQLTADRISIMGEAFKGDGTAIFVALKRLDEPDRTAALFHPFSPAAAEQAARKIPHYGKYSYLVFADGTNLAKGTWKSLSSPVVYEFPPE